MVKWWWKLETQNGLWQKIIRARYLKKRTVATVEPRFNDSPCWKALLKGKTLYMAGRKIKTNSGEITRVWKDSINGHRTFQDCYPLLFDICTEQDCTVAKVKAVTPNTFFRRRLTPDLQRQWGEMRGYIDSIRLGTGGD